MSQRSLKQAARKERYFEVSQLENAHQEFSKNGHGSSPAGTRWDLQYSGGPKQSNISPKFKTS